MMRSANKIKKIFGKTKTITVGVIHLPPLLGYSDFPGFAPATRNALRDLRALESGGFDAVIFENNYDLPHREFVSPSVIVSLTQLGARIKAATNLPIGISVLWNDYPTALSIAKTLDLAFIRVPVFVDRVKTAYGIIDGTPQKVLEVRKELGAEHVALFTDIHVKHAELLSSQSLVESAQQAIACGSDALVVTGKWTGDAPQMKELSDLRAQISDFPILAGSGVDKTNIRAICAFANGVIVSTALKSGNARTHDVNVKSYSQRINARKAKALVKSLHT